MNRRELLKGGLGVGAAVGLAQELRAEQSSASKRSVRVIDCHVHAGTGQAMSQPWTTYNDPEVTLRHAEEAGIDQSIIFPIENPTYEKPNEEIARIVAQYPGKFIGFAKHDPVAEAGRVKAMLTHEVKDLGLKGLKLHKLPTREVLESVAELKIPILFHPPKVSDFHLIASTFPQINFIMAHLGSYTSQNWTEHLAAIDAAKRYPNVYLETSTVVHWRYLEMAARELPDHKVLFGSDGPDGDSRVELYKIRLLKLPADKEEQVLGANVLRLLPS
jgi:predicted TIM-barrel fold metal-dependent hydrolase